MHSRARKGRGVPVWSANACLPRRQVAADPATVWQSLRVPWYQVGICQVEVASQTALWYRAGKPVVPIRWVLVREPVSQRLTKILFCTDVRWSPQQILEGFMRRWNTEVTVQECR